MNFLWQKLNSFCFFRFQVAFNLQQCPFHSRISFLYFFVFLRLLLLQLQLSLSLKFSLHSVCWSSSFISTLLLFPFFKFLIQRILVAPQPLLPFTLPVAQKYKSESHRRVIRRRERKERRREKVERKREKTTGEEWERENEVHTFSFFLLHQNDDKAHFFSVFLSFSLLTINCLRLDIAVECEISPRVHLNDSARAKLNEKVKSEPVTQPADIHTHKTLAPLASLGSIIVLCVERTTEST